MKKVLLAVFLTMIAINCSGCATILGGIIGYQSGEAVAGAAIGAAIDIAGAIAHDAREKEEKQERKEQEEKLEKERKESVKIYPEEGYIRVGSISADGRNFSEELKRRFDNIGWAYTESEQKPEPGEEITKKTFDCTTTDGKQFTLELLRERNRDLLVFIKPSEPNKELQSMLTSQIGIWVREIAGL